MELCPKCKRMSAEKNHYNGRLYCYAKNCLAIFKAGVEVTELKVGPIGSYGFSGHAGPIGFVGKGMGGLAGFWLYCTGFCDIFNNSLAIKQPEPEGRMIRIGEENE